MVTEDEMSQDESSVSAPVLWKAVQFPFHVENDEDGD